MTRRLSTARAEGKGRAATIALCVIVLLALPISCPRKQAPEKTVARDPFADLPEVLSRQARRIREQTAGIRNLFNETEFQVRKQDAERFKAEQEAKIKQLEEEIKQRVSYVDAIQALRDNIEADSAWLPRYLERVTQVSSTSPSGEDLWKVAAIWVSLETRSSKYRDFVDDACAGQMAQKYLGLSDQVQKETESKVQPVLSRMYSDFSTISAAYGRETNVSRLEQHIRTLTKFAETLNWVGSDYFDMHHALRQKMMADRGRVIEPSDTRTELFAMTFDKILRDIAVTTDNVRQHISVCRVYNDCRTRFARIMENGLQAKDVPIIDDLKKRLTDKRPQAPNEDSANLLLRGRDEIDGRVEREVNSLRRTRDQFEEFCDRPPDFAKPESYLNQLRNGQQELRTMKIIFGALNLFDDAKKADTAGEHARRLEKAYPRRRQMHEAYQEMQAYARELERLPSYPGRTASQQQKAKQMLEKLRDYKIRFSPWVQDPDLEDDVDHCLSMIDELVRQIGE